MSHTFTFHFSSSPTGPRVMAIIDLEASCPTCGYTEIQRFYHGLSFHPLTLPRFKQHIQDSPLLLGYDCSNCGDPVTTEHVERGAWTYGFPDGRGILQAFFQHDAGQLQGLHYILDPRTAFDPQALPIWGREDVDRHTERFEQVDDDVLFERFGRVFTPKNSWRLLWQEHLDTGEMVMEEAAPGCWLLLGDDPDEALSWAHESLAQPTERVIPVSLTRPPTKLVRPIVTPLPGRYTRWMPSDALAGLANGSCYAFALLAPHVALKRLSATLRRGHLQFEIGEDDQGVPTFHTITTPREETFASEIHVSDVLAYAAHTGTTPGDAARFVGEALIGELMGLEIG